MSSEKTRGASLAELGAVWTVLRDVERESDEHVAMERLVVMAIVAKVGLSGATWVPIVVSRIAEELGTSRRTVKTAMDAVAGELLEFDVSGSPSGKGRRVNRARVSAWLKACADEVLAEEGDE